MLWKLNIYYREKTEMELKLFAYKSEMHKIKICVLICLHCIKLNFLFVILQLLACTKCQICLTRNIVNVVQFLRNGLRVTKCAYYRTISSCLLSRKATSFFWQLSRNNVTHLCNSSYKAFTLKKFNAQLTVHSFVTVNCLKEIVV